MECFICSNHSSSDNGLLCVACARSSLYNLRIEHANSLLTKERLGRQVQAIVTAQESPNNRDGKIPDTTLNVHEGARQWRHEETLSGLVESRERIDAIVRQSERFQAQMETYKREIASKKTTIAARRADLALAAAGLSTLRSDLVNPIKKAIRKTTSRHLSLHDELVSARAYLCAEAASLAGLRQRRHSTADGKSLESYSIGKVAVMDLRRLNDYTPAEISAALSNVTQLLFLVCYYLGIRLPSELVVPGEQRPMPAIYQAPSSYKDHVPDESTPNASEGGLFGAATVAHPQRIAVRPRPLSTDQRLSLLAREHPSQYLKFIHGVVFLAWNIAWLCRTQGIIVAKDDWEDVCAVGRNLWLLLISAPRTTPPTSKSARLPPNRIQDLANVNVLRQGSGDATDPSGQGDSETQEIHPSLGLLSHATTRALLGSASAGLAYPSASLFRSWSFASPVPVIDRLKAFLLAEMSGLEWEVLDEEEYSGIDGDRLSSSRIGATDDIALATGNNSGGEGRTRGNSGWTKLKSRPTI